MVYAFSKRKLGIGPKIDFWLVHMSSPSKNILFAKVCVRARVVRVWMCARAKKIGYIDLDEILQAELT